ncbi:hypothetical protein HDA43_002864 [Streptosporangium sandarakinum]|uniref:Uncharacterized protein n=1 Tax=Streptosporangium sandarakinum TaxID=1260955 RepID=A0A852V481_9ACTN|nr:hypothetical protein [Streptosporangium sandarakinum]
MTGWGWVWAGYLLTAATWAAYLLRSGRRPS